MRETSRVRAMQRAAKSKKPAPMKALSLKLPREVWDLAMELGQHVRGGASEVLRRAIKAGLPLVQVQSHIVKSDH
jgi:hypothetical protein